MRCGAVRCGAVRCGAVRCGAVRCSVVEKVDSLEKTMFFLTSLTGYRFHLARVSGYECYCLGTLLQVFQTYMM